MSTVFSNDRVRRVYLTTADSSPWTVPSDWSNTANKVECIGAGASGLCAGANQAGGGGGGAYASNTNFAFAAGATVQFQVGVGGAVGTVGNNTLTGTAANGGNTWFSGTSLAACNVGAEGGYAYQTTANGNWGPGGSTANSVGTVKYAGGNGGKVWNSQRGGTGGGGAAGPGGAGGSGGEMAQAAGGGQVNAGGGGGGNGGGKTGDRVFLQADDAGASNGGDSAVFIGGMGAKGTILYANSSHKGNDGQAGFRGSGGGGGNPSGFDGSQIGTGSGGAGGAGIEWDSTHGSGGGGGGAGGSGAGVATLVCSNGGAGGLYGGGGGGGGQNDSNNGIGTGGFGGPGANGLIVITYTSSNTSFVSNAQSNIIPQPRVTWSVPFISTSNTGSANNLTFASYSVTAGDYLIVCAHRSSGSSRTAVSADCTQSSGTATISGFTLDKTLEYSGGYDGAFYTTAIFSTQVTVSGTIVIRVGSSTIDSWSGSVTPIRPSANGTLTVLSSNTCQGGTQSGWAGQGYSLLNSGVVTTDKPSIIFSVLNMKTGVTITPQTDWTTIFNTTTTASGCDIYRIFNDPTAISHTWRSATTDNTRVGATVAYGITNTAPTTEYAAAQINVVQTTTGNTGPLATMPYTQITVTAGNWVVAAIESYTPNTVNKIWTSSDISQTAGTANVGAWRLNASSWENRSTILNASDGWYTTAIWSAQVTVSGTLTLTANVGTGAFSGGGLMEIAGNNLISTGGTNLVCISSNSSYDPDGSAKTYHANTGSCPVTDAPAIAVAVYCLGDGSATWTPSTGWTNVASWTGGGGFSDGAVVYSKLSNTATTNAQPWANFNTAGGGQGGSGSQAVYVLYGFVNKSNKTVVL